MKEVEWDSSTDPQAMLAFLRDSGKLSERKSRLFAAACCRRIWHLFIDERARKGAEVAERYANGEVGRGRLTTACHAAEQAFEDANAEVLTPGVSDSRLARLAEAVTAAAYWATHPNFSHEEDVANATAEAVHLETGDADAERGSQADLLRDLFGPLPFRPVPIDPSLLRWHAGLVVRLAQAAYDNRQLPAGTLEPERLAVLADALEEAGCTDKDLLGHLREQGADHVRGCWVVDTLLNIR